MIVYLAGPYRADTPRGIVENIQRAEKVALELWAAGYPTICPHKNTALFDGGAPDEVWLSGDLEILRRCDVLVLLPGWHESSGSVEEKILAKSLGIPVYEWPALSRLEELRNSAP